MPAPARFLFDQDFAAAAEVKPAIPLAVHEAGLLEADASGYQRGFAAAKAEILAEAEQRTAAALERIVATLEGVGRGLSGVEAKLETEAVDVAVAVAKKLAVYPEAPRAVVRRLAADEFEVAESVLRHSPALTSEDLLTITIECGWQHAAAIASREMRTETAAPVAAPETNDRGLQAIAETASESPKDRVASDVP